MPNNANTIIVPTLGLIPFSVVTAKSTTAVGTIPQVGEYPLKTCFQITF